MFIGMRGHAAGCAQVFVLDFSRGRQVLKETLRTPTSPPSIYRVSIISFMRTILRRAIREHLP